MRKLVFIFLLFFILYACAKGYGTAYMNKNVTVYYSKEKDRILAMKLSDYWINNALVTKKPQTLRISYSDKGERQIQLILNEISDANTLNFEELKLLQNLENEINQTIFKNAKADVVLCDSRFNIVNNLNF